MKKRTPEEIKRLNDAEKAGLISFGTVNGRKCYRRTCPKCQRLIEIKNFSKMASAPCYDCTHPTPKPHYEFKLSSRHIEMTCPCGTFISRRVIDGGWFFTCPNCRVEHYR